MLTKTADLPLEYLQLEDGRRIAVRRREPPSPGQPTLMFLPGYASDMQGTKARAVDALAERRGYGCLRFDYSGTGASEGNFEQGTLQRWLDEALAVIDRLSRGPLILVGSSMGGWLMLLAALRRPDRVAGLVGIAAAPDFTEWGYSTEEKTRIEREGRIERINPYGPEPDVTHLDFWRSGQSLLLGDSIAVDCPVRLLHGAEDAEVPVRVAVELMGRLQSPDVRLLIVKGGGHRLSEPQEIEALTRVTEALARQVVQD